ncbi:hypothetical protein RSAG8_05177, partial [Rhizoctonia solani AG-8 WAC10335]
MFIPLIGFRVSGRQSRSRISEFQFIVGIQSSLLDRSLHPQSIYSCDQSAGTRCLGPK